MSLVSGATATLIAGVLAVVGTLLGVAVGQLLEDRRRRRGEVRREVRAWSGGSTGTVSESRVFEVRFFNDRDVNVALWDVQVEHYREGRRTGYIVPRPAGRPEAEVEPIDLESRKSVYMELELEAEGEELSLLKEADEIKFVATMMPSGESVSKDLPTWDDLASA